FFQATHNLVLLFRECELSVKTSISVEYLSIDRRRA
uniref:Uncharacterized protein n=1 Tax=Anopheles albimanus TaxID=7167 RepID=A0A182FYD4_ANOAL